MKNLFLTGFIIFLSVLCSAQTFSVEFGATYPFIPPIETSFDNEFESVSLDLLSLPDSIFIKRVIRSSGNSIRKFETKKIGFEGGLNLNWAVKKNIGIETGIHAKAYSFNRSFETTNSFFDVIKTDTVDAPATSTLINSTFSCDRFVNNTSELLDRDFTDLFEIVDLYLPLKISYSIWDGEINFFVGGYFSVPIYSKRTFDFLRIESEEINGETVCEFAHNLNKTDSFNEFTRLNYGMQFGIDYQLSRSVSVALTADQRFTKLLSYDNFITVQPEPLFDSSNTKISFISGTVKYKINPPQ